MSRHASSYTPHRCPPAGSRSADSIHAQAHVVKTAMSVAFSVTRDRSREIISKLGSKVTVDETSILGESTVVIINGVGGEESVDDHGEHWYVG